MDMEDTEKPQNEMKALLDTNIVIHRETHRILNQDIGILFKWLDKVKYEKCVHPVTIQEIEKNPNPDTRSTFAVKLDSYVQLQTVAPMKSEVVAVGAKFDVNDNDRNDTILLNEVFVGRVDIFISEDKKIHQKARALGLEGKVFRINTFLEKVFAENPDLANYKVLSVKKARFGELDLADAFFETLIEDYPGFDKWFNKKAEELAYVTQNRSNGKLLSFLYIKREDPEEGYPDIVPAFAPKKRLKVGTFKVVSNGVRLGERFLKIIFDNARIQKVDEVYVTIFDKRPEQRRLIELLEDWGFVLFGRKGAEELVYVRDFTPKVNFSNPKLSYPYISLKANIYLVPIYPEYHTELLPDSILNNERTVDFLDDEPHRNAISKVYVSHSFERTIKKGDVLVFYRTGGYHLSVVTTVAIVDEVIQSLASEADFIAKCRNRSVFTDAKLKEQWNYKPNDRPFLVNFLYVYSFPRRINLQRMIELGILAGVHDAPRGFKAISREKFMDIIKNTDSDARFIVD
jgi:predicted nucleic acid-binding protein